MNRRLDRAYRWGKLHSFLAPATPATPSTIATLSSPSAASLSPTPDFCPQSVNVMAALQPGIQFDSELARNSTRRDSLDSPLSTFAQAPSPSPIAAATAMPLPASPPPGPSRSPSPTSASGASHARFGSETAYAAPSPPPPSESMNFPSKTQHQHQALVTPVDSRPFDYPSPSPPPQQPLPHLPASVKAAHNHTRDLSLVSTTSSITSVKRKPLPLNAKPIAFRDSTGASSAPSFETPGPRFYRAPSIDSPTLWEAGLFKQSDIPQSLQDRQRRPPS